MAMQKIVISFFLFTFTAIVMFSSTRSFAQQRLPKWSDSLGQALIQLDSGLWMLKRSDLDLKGLHFDSTLKDLRKFQRSKSRSSKDYYSKNGERYFIRDHTTVTKSQAGRSFAYMAA